MWIWKHNEDVYKRRAYLQPGAWFILQKSPQFGSKFTFCNLQFTFCNIPPYPAQNSQHTFRTFFIKRTQPLNWIPKINQSTTFNLQSGRMSFNLHPLPIPKWEYFLLTAPHRRSWKGKNDMVWIFKQKQFQEGLKRRKKIEE